MYPCRAVQLVHAVASEVAACPTGRSPLCARALTSQSVSPMHAWCSCRRARKEAAQRIHIPPAERGTVRTTAWQQGFWQELRGNDIEKLMRCGAIALVDASWLVSYAASGSILRPRQQMPYESYVSVDELLAAQIDCEYLRIACVSQYRTTESSNRPDHSA